MEIYIALGTSVLLQVLKDKRISGRFRDQFFKVYRTIHFVFASDPDFIKMLEGIESGEITK